MRRNSSSAPRASLVARSPIFSARRGNTSPTTTTSRNQQAMHFYNRELVNGILRLAPRQSYRLVRKTSSGRISSDVLLELLNRSRVGIKDAFSCFPSDIITPEEVTLKYGITKSELRKWYRRKLNPSPHFRLNKYTIRYPQSLLCEWLKENSK